MVKGLGIEHSMVCQNLKAEPDVILAPVNFFQFVFIPPLVQAPLSRKQELSRRIKLYESLMTTFEHNGEESVC